MRIRCSFALVTSHVDGVWIGQKKKTMCSARASFHGRERCVAWLSPPRGRVDGAQGPSCGLRPRKQGFPTPTPTHAHACVFVLAVCALWGRREGVRDLGSLTIS